MPHGRLSILEADFKAVELAGRGITPGVDARHPRPGRSLFKLDGEGIEGFVTPLRDHLDAAVRAVGGPARKAEPARLPARKIAKAHALDATRDQGVETMAHDADCGRPRRPATLGVSCWGWTR